MAGYQVRSLSELAAEAKAAFVQAVQGTAANLWPNVWRVESKVLALIGFGLEMRRAWLVRQIFASTADEKWLIRHGYEYGLQPGAGTAAIGSATLAASPGVVVPAGLQYARADGVTFSVASTVTADANGATIALVAGEAAATGNTDPGTVLTLVTPSQAPAGLSPTCIVVAAADYSEWVQAAVPTTTKVFVDSFQNDERSVWVQFLVSDQPNGIPSDGQVAIAQAYVSDPIRRPITARPFVTAPAAVPVGIVIAAFAPDTPDNRANVEAEVAAAFADRAEPGRPSQPFTFSASWIDEAISRATGEDSHDLQSPGDLTFAAGQYPVLGTISYTD